MLNQRTVIGVLMVLFGLCANCRADTEPTGQVEHVIAEPGDSRKKEATIIPLDQVWALNMPGTRDLRRLTLQLDDQELPALSPMQQHQHRLNSKLEQLRRSIKRPKTENGQAAPGFTVLGTGKEALDNAFAVLVSGNKALQVFPAERDLSLAFFSYSTGQYVHLHEVERRGNRIEVKYRFTPHLTKELTAHFATIPLGILPSDVYHVEITRSPMKEEFATLGIKAVTTAYEDRIVCKSFSFTVH